jgi:hypothetical protein
VLVRHGPGAVVAVGQAAVLDLFRPLGLLSSLPELFVSGAVLAGYTARHLEDVVGILAERFGGDGLPSARLVLAVRPEATAVVDGTEVVEVEGNWQPADRSGDAGDRNPEMDVTRTGTGEAEEAGEHPGDLLAQDGPVAVGWQSPYGPIALPGAWDAAERRATVPTTLVGLAGLPARSPACLTFDDSQPGSLSGKRGIVLRGTGALDPGDGGATTSVSLDTERVTSWQGAQTRTTDT